MVSMFFVFNDTATTEIYPLSLHGALPICHRVELAHRVVALQDAARVLPGDRRAGLDLRPGDLRVLAGALAADRKSTRLNSSHANISYAVFCLKKKNPTSIKGTKAHNLYTP